MYQLNHNNNPEAVTHDETIEDVRESLKDFWNTAFTIVEDGSPELEDDFLYRSKSQYNEIDSMDFEQLKEKFKEFDWSLWNIELTNEEMILVNAVRDSGLSVRKLLNEINNVYRETPYQNSFKEAMGDMNNPSSKEPDEIKVLYIVENVYDVESILSYTREGFQHLVLHENGVLMLSTKPVDIEDNDMLHDFLDNDIKHFLADDGTRITIIEENELKS